MTDRDTRDEQLWSASRLTLGVEEEFHLVDLATRRLTPRAQDVLARLSESDGPASARTRKSSRAGNAAPSSAPPSVLGREPLIADAGGFAPELQQSVVETNSAVTSSLAELKNHLSLLRRQLCNTAESLGVGVAAAGTMPLGVPLTITENPRFRRMLADYQLLVREQLICGLQIHVGIGTRDTAVRLIDRVSPWLPPLLALSASSPFSQTGDDTGYASTRTLIWSRWPTTGRAGVFNSAAEYDALVQKLVASGVISDPGMLYFDVRPSAHVPTLELRICDSCPSVDTITLIAALFRAVVLRELGRLNDGQPFTPLSPAIERAAMWRAARSGLEGELVDLSGPRSVPAPMLLRNLVQELRTELESHGDYETARELTEQALAQGSSAARQRDVLAQRERITDVVDAILAETRGERAFAPGHAQEATLLSAYASPSFDEAVSSEGRARRGHARVLDTLNGLGAAALHERSALLERKQLEAGVVFKSAGKETASAFPIDICPRVLTGEEWSRLQGGVAQRARALDAFLRDVYSDGAILRDGIVPEWLVQHSPGYRSAGTAPAPSTRRVQVSGFDVIRDQDGRWLVLEDNVRVPSGVGYAISSRRLMRDVFPELFQGTDLLDPEQVPALLRTALEESAPPRASDSPHVVVLSAGPTDSAYFEHKLLADGMGVPLVEPSELLVSDGKAWHVEASGRSRVDVIYLRMDDQLAHRRGANGAVIGPQLVAAVRAQTLTLANALGNGVADDKAIYSFVPKFIQYYLGELPLIEQVPTYHCSEPEQLRLVLSRLNELVVKPVDGYGGLGVVVGPRATEQELVRTRALLEESPERWIAQETVMLSTHPTLEADRLRPRHVDLRVFVYYGAQPVVVPAALTRVAPSGSLVVNSSRGGGGKDTWLAR